MNGIEADKGRDDADRHQDADQPDENEHWVRQTVAHTLDGAKHALVRCGCHVGHCWSLSIVQSRFSTVEYANGC